MTFEPFENSFHSETPIVPITHPLGLTNRFPENIRTGTDTLGDDSDFALFGFYGTNVTLSSSTSYAYDGTRSLEAEPTPPSTAFVTLKSQFETEIPVLSGEEYVFKYRAYTPVATTFYVELRWLDDDLNEVLPRSTNSVAVSGSIWTEVGITANAPAGVEYVRAVVFWDIVDVNPAPEVFEPASAYFDAFSLYNTDEPSVDFLSYDQRTGTGISLNTDDFSGDNCTLHSDSSVFYVPDPTLDPETPGIPVITRRSLRADLAYVVSVDTYSPNALVAGDGTLTNIYLGVDVEFNETYATTFRVFSEVDFDLTSRLSWYTSSDTLIGYESTQNTFPGNSWNIVELAGTAPVGAAYARVSSWWSGGTGRTLYFDNFIFWSLRNTFDSLLSEKQHTFDSPLEYIATPGTHASLAKALPGGVPFLEDSPTLILTTDPHEEIVVSTSVNFPQVFPGRTYTATAKVFDPYNRTLTIRIWWIPSEGGPVYSTAVFPPSDDPDQWRSISVTGVAPDGADNASVQIVFESDGDVSGDAYLTEIDMWEGPPNSDLLLIDQGVGDPNDIFNVPLSATMEWSGLSDPSYTGHNSLKLDPQGADALFYFRREVGDEYLRIYPNNQYSAHVKVISNNVDLGSDTPATVELGIIWINAYGAHVGVSSSERVSVSMLHWDTLRVTGVAPPEARYASIRVFVADVPGVEASDYRLFFDDFALWEGPLYQFSLEFRYEFWVDGTPTNETPTYLTCIPDTSQPIGTQRIIGTHMPGDRVVKITRTNLKDKDQYVIRASREIEFSDDNKSLLVLDPEAPLDQEFIYTVTVEFDTTPKTYEEVSTPLPCEYPALAIYAGDIQCVPVLLSDPLIIGFGEWVGLLSIDALTHPSRQELSDVIGQPWPVSISGIRSAPRTTMRLLTRTLDGRSRLLNVLQSGRVLLLRNPDPSFPENNWYIAVGSVSEERIFADQRRPERRWVVEIAQVARPSGYITYSGSGRTYATLRDYLPDGVTEAPDGYTYATVRSLYRTYIDVVIGGDATVGPLGNVLPAGGGPTFPTISGAESSWSLT